MRGLPRVDFFYPQIICCTHIQNNTKAIGATTTIANPRTIRMSLTTSFRICIFFVSIIEKLIFSSAKLGKKKMTNWLIRQLVNFLSKSCQF